MLSRFASRITLTKTPFRSFVAMWPPIKGSKLVGSLDDAVKGIKDGSMIMLGGYGKLGAPHNLVSALAKSQAKNLTVVCGVACCAEKGSAIQELLEQKKVSKIITSSVGENQLVMEQFKKGELEVELMPMGTIAEKARSGGFGVPAFYSHVGIGTFHEEGGVPTKFAKDGKTVLSVNLAREKRQFHGKDYLLERTFLGDYAFVKAWKADTKGNCILKLANRNFNPDMAISGKVCIVEADEVLEPGAFDGDDIHIAGIFVHKVVKAASSEQTCKTCTGKHTLGTGETKKIREMMIKRAAQEIKEGSYVVLTCGLPKAIQSYVPESADVHYVYPGTGVFGGVKDNHMSGVADGCLSPLGLRKNAAITKTSDGFAALRGNHLNVAFTEAYQVSEDGDLASIENGSQFLPSPDIQMDLAAASPKTPLVVLMELASQGKPNLVKKCSYRVAGRKCVSKLITDMGVFEFKADGMHLIEVAPGVKVEDIKNKTPCTFKVASGLKTMSA